MLGDDLEYGALTQVEDLVLAAGYLGGKCYFLWSDDRGQSQHLFADGETKHEIAESEAQQPALEILTTQEVLVALTRGDTVYTYLSTDFGETWRPVDNL